MTYAPSIVLRALIAAKSYATLPSANQDWPLYMVSLPDTDLVKDDALCVYDLPGTKDGRLMQSGTVIELSNMQLKARARAHRAGHDKIMSIASMFDTRQRVAIKSGNYVWSFLGITRDPVYPLGQEHGNTKRRYLFTLNFGLHLSEYGPDDPAGASAALANALEVIEVDFATYFGTN